MAEQPKPLHLYALGPPEVRLGETLVIFPTKKTLALLIYMATESSAQPRETLAALLWPEASPERSRGSLRNTLDHLQTAFRQASGKAQISFLLVTHNSLSLDPDAKIDFDLRTVERAYTQARADRSSRTLPEGSSGLPLLRSAAACQRGDFLAGFSLGDAPGFDDWAAMQREVWNRRLGLILDRLAEIQFAHGEFAGATETASRWIALDALNEVAYRRKMRAHFAAGERGQALETYETCHAILAAELGVEPEPDTVALAEGIRAQASFTNVRVGKYSPQPQQVETSINFLGSLFTGRAREYQELVKCYERASGNQPQLLVLRGEVGIGKTRLAGKFFQWASAQGAELLLGSAFESGIHLPFQPLVEAFRQRLAGDNAFIDKIDEIWLSPLSQLLPELRQYHPNLSPPPGDYLNLEADVIHAQLYEPLVHGMLALAEQVPLVLFIDDLQWADSATLDLLQYAIRRWKDNAARILFMASLRSDALRPVTHPQTAGSPQGLSIWLERMAREVIPVHIELEPLGEDEAVPMMLSILSPPDVDFARWLYRETRGQPYYLIETLKDLLERSVLHPKRRVGGQWSFSVDSDHNLGQAVRVPSTVHAVIRSRLNRLSPNAFSLLAGGAVLEHRIIFERMCAISSLSEDLALPGLDELISGRLLLEALQPGLISEYKFPNEMLRDVVYTEAGDARRRLFHRRAFDVLEKDWESAAILAHHAQAAGLAEVAFRYSLAAGREAMRLTALNEAIVHFEHALQFVREAKLPEIAGEKDLRDLYTQLSLVYQLGGQMEKALAIDAERDRLLVD